MSDERIRMREWSKQVFYKPEDVLCDPMTRTPIGFIPEGQHPGWVALRSNMLNQKRQWLDATVFTLGLCQALGIDALIAPHEGDDFDFIVSWPADGEQNACPVQLKELVPDHLNPNADLNSLISGLTRYASSSDTIVAIKLNRAGQFDPNTLKVPALPFKQVWLFGCDSPDHCEWFLYGDLVSDLRYFTFRLPT